MSQNQLRTHTSDSPSHTRRRRHAAPSEPTWVRRAGLVGGVVSALALCGAAAPAMADNTHTASTTDTASTTTRTIADSAQQAADAFEQGAINASLTATQEQAVADAARSAATTKKSADAKVAAARKAAWVAKERAAAAKATAAKAAAAKAAAAKATAQAAPTVAATTAAAAPAATPAAATPTATTTAAPASSSKADQLIAFLKAQIGKPYVWGATGPASYDCSGLTQAAFASIGVTIPRTSEDQSTIGTPVSLDALQPGDLIFWGGEGSAFHVGVFIGNGQYLDAANPSTPVGIKQMVDYMPDWAVRAI